MRFKMKSFIILLAVIILSSYNLICRGNFVTKSLKQQYLTLDNGRQFIKLGNTWREANNYELAKYYLDKGYDIIKNNNNEYWIAVAYEFYGYYYKDIGEYETALQYLYSAYNIYKRIITLPNGSPKAVKKVISDIENSLEPELQERTYPGPEPDHEPPDESESNNDIEKRLSRLEIRVDNLEERVEEVSGEISEIRNTVDKIWEKVKIPTPPPLIIPPSFHGNAISMIGVGFGSTYGIGDMRFPPISISMNYRVSENYEIGLFLGYSSELYQNIKFDYRIVGLRLLLRMWKGEDWDISSSLMIGYNSLSANAPLTGINVSQEKILYGGIVDFRYFFSQNIGVFLETGYGLTYASGGVVFSF